MLLIIFSVLLFILIAVSTAVSHPADPVTGVLGGSSAVLICAFRPVLTTYVLFLPCFLFIFFLYGVFLSGFSTHVFVILFGGQKGLARTVKTMMYAGTPVLLLGWIPLVSIIGPSGPMS